MTVSIAVVEDDVRILDAVALVLEAEAWTVQTYNSGEAFLNDLASNAAPNCLILDPHLPGMNGADVAKEVMRNTRDARIPIIVLTARPNSPVTVQVVEAGARTVLTKPVAAEELISQIQAALANL